MNHSTTMEGDDELIEVARCCCLGVGGGEEGRRMYQHELPLIVLERYKAVDYW